MLIKLLILPIYLVLPFLMIWLDAPTAWLLPFIIWFVCIVVNAMVERSRGPFS